MTTKLFEPTLWLTLVLALSVLVAGPLMASSAGSAPMMTYTWQEALNDAAEADRAIAALAPLAAIDELAKKEPISAEDQAKVDELKSLREKRAKGIEIAREMIGEERAELIDLFESKVRARRVAEFQALMQGETPKDAASALKLSDSIVDFVATWKGIYGDSAVVDNRALTAILPFLALHSPAQFDRRPAPFQPFSSSDDKLAFIAMLERFAAFVPAMRTAALFKDGKPAPHGYLAAAIDENDPMAIRACVNAVVDDLNKTYGDLEATKAVREAIVRQYSAATTLGSTGIFATIFAIFGSLVLFGGLAHAIYKAANAKSPPPAEELV